MSGSGAEGREATDLHDLHDRPIANDVGGEWTRPSGGVAEDVVRFHTAETEYIERWPDREE